MKVSKHAGALLAVALHLIIEGGAMMLALWGALASLRGFPLHGSALSQAVHLAGMVICVVVFLAFFDASRSLVGKEIEEALKP